MSALLALIVVGGAVWFVVTKAGVRPGAVREPMDSVSDFARAMSALDPAAPLRRQVAQAPPPHARRRPRPVVAPLSTGAVHPLPRGR